MKRQLASCLVVLFGLPAPALAQQSILAPSRTIDYSHAGVIGGIPDRSTICSTLNPGATAAQINTAIANCPSGQVVYLSAGTYSIGSPGIIFNNKSNVTLRGAGPDATFLNFTAANSCGGPDAAVCFLGAANSDPTNPPNTATWSAGYAKGSTTVTLSNKTNLQVGGLLAVGQAWDSAETGNVYVCHGSTCTYSGGGGPSRTGTEQVQWVVVTSIESGTCAPNCDIGIDSPIYMPNIRSGQSPNAYWPTGLPLTNSGIEDISINVTSTTAQNAIEFFGTRNTWVKNVRSIKPYNHHVKVIVSSHVTVRDSYFFDGQNHTSESYGINPYACSDLLVENNIFQRITSAVVNETTTGNVFGYNYTINDKYQGGWAQASLYTHAMGNSFLLFESNDAFGVTLDNYHGPAHFITLFRNRLLGTEALQSPPLDSQTVPVYIYSFNRYTNVIGNVLGDNAFHTNYQNMYGVNSENIGACYRSIYAVGWGGNCEINTAPTQDTLTVTTLMRWGNYDTVNDAARWVSSEVPSGLSAYANPMPTDQVLPSSLYLLGKPSWFGSTPWPAIGPDVTGGSEPNVGGHNARIPARRCFEDVMHGTFTDTSARTFNARSCYASPPRAPTGVRIVR